MAGFRRQLYVKVRLADRRIALQPDTAVSATLKPLAHPKYRADIDGLRAVAVLSVVCFHAFASSLSGGFIGVDIFFVISGFLISSIIFENLERASFSFTVFYARRIKRIFPGLLLVLIASYGFGWFVLLADEYKHLGKHVAGGAGFISNYLLWRESGYFDTAAESKPLLHLWSLAIEEQFYIFWPLLLAFAWKRHARFLTIIAVVAIASFAANIYLTARDPTAAFYFPISRFWELMIGCALAYITLHRPALIDRHRNLQSAAGFALLITGLLILDQGRAFPGWWALLPTLGSFLVIAGGPGAWLNHHLLSNKILVWFGLISYPLYLWHWPLLSFARIVDGDTPSATVTAMAVLAAILLSWLTYLLVELPIRRGAHSQTKTIALVISMICVFAAGVLGYEERIVPRYRNPALQSVMSAPNEWEYLANLKKSSKSVKGIYYVDSTRPETTVFLGDSHVAQYGPRIGSLLAGNAASANSVIFVVDGGCVPIQGVFEDNPSHAGCDELRAKGFDLIRQENVKTLVIGADWNDYFLNQTRYPKEKSLEYDYYYAHHGKKEYFRRGSGKQLTLAALEQFLSMIGKTKKVYLLLDNPRGSNFDPHRFFNTGRLSTPAASAPSRGVAIDPAEFELRRQMVDLAERAGVEIIDPWTSLCDKLNCARLTVDGKPIYKDSSHLSATWVREHADYLDKTVIPR